MKTGVVLFAHGSRDPEWARPFRAIERKVAQANADKTVALAFLELMQPTLPEAIDRLAAQGCARITIAPLFMAQGAHLKRDLAKIVEEARARHASVELATLPAAGEADTVMGAIAAWIADNVDSKT
ncbi:MAG TPA: CbiX/SirB N-terminal domain-containing protein [Burkholderiales bacterium]|nr:CbiX/SirB N-terminal domain-containing protein [Burkholderiales bacterium]